MLVKPVLKIVDLFQIPKILQVLLRLLTHASILTAEELEAAGSVLGPEAVQYPKVRIAEGGVMTLFRTINLPAKGHHSRGHLKLLVHEPRKPRVTHTEAGRVWLRNVRAASGLAISTVSS